MSGTLAVNCFESCKDVTVKMDNTTIISDHADVKINHLRNVSRANISMQNLKVISAHVAAPNSGIASSLTLNRIDQSKDTKINQVRMQISGEFDEMAVNGITHSAKTAVSMHGAAIKPRNASAESDDDSTGTHAGPKQKRHTDGDHDSDAEPIEVRLHFDLPGSPGTGGVFSTMDTVNDVIECISVTKPPSKGKKILLEDFKTKELLGMDYTMTLHKAGIRHDMDLRVVEVEAD